MPYIRKIFGVDVNGPLEGTLGTTITGTLSETLSQSVLIPANTFQQYDIVGVYGRLRKQNTNNVATIRLRINTTPTIGGQVVGLYTSTVATHLLIPISRRLVIKTANGTGDGTFVINNTSTIGTDIGSDTQGHVSLPINWTVDNYLIVTGQLSNVSDILNCTICAVDCPQGELQR